MLKAKVVKKEEGVVMESDTTTFNKQVTGKVVSADGIPLIGATVIVKNTNTGATTDAEGNFSIPISKPNTTILVRSVGFESRELVVKGKTLLVTLNMAVQSIEETVIKGYYSTTQRLNTGNVATVTGKEIGLQPVSNPLAALQGRVPGLFITQTTGVPGGAFNITIRGINSINNGIAPFFVVDGVPYTSQLLPNNAGNILQPSVRNSLQGGNPLSFINPADIESITILKDADATSIYGSRAANGVILITTKKGKPGRTTVNFKVSSGISEVAKLPSMLNLKDYLQMRRQAFQNDGVTPTKSNAPDLLLWDTTKTTDWGKKLIGSRAQFTNISSTVSGGSELIQYLIGGTYHKETTVFPGNFADRKGSIHFNLNTISANKKMTINLSGSYLIDDNKLPISDLTRFINLPPNAPEPFNTDGTLNWANGTWPGNNPYAVTLQTYKSQTNNLVSNILLGYQILPGLQLKSNFGYSNMQIDEITTTPIRAQNPSGTPKTGNSTFTNNNVKSWIAEPQLNYQLNLGSGKVDALIGATFQQNTSRGLIESATGYTSDALLENIQAGANRNIMSFANTLYKYSAIFGRVSYNLKDRYIINMTARRDGSSRFGENNKFHNFGSLGVAWVFSEEELLKRKVPLLSFGKIRASFGTTGSDQIGDYRFYDLFSTNFYTYQGVVGLTPASLFQPELSLGRN